MTSAKLPVTANQQLKQTNESHTHTAKPFTIPKNALHTAYIHRLQTVPSGLDTHTDKDSLFELENVLKTQKNTQELLYIPDNSQVQLLLRNWRLLRPQSSHHSRRHSIPISTSRPCHQKPSRPCFEYHQTRTNPFVHKTFRFSADPTDLVMVGVEG